MGPHRDWALNIGQTDQVIKSCRYSSDPLYNGRGTSWIGHKQDHQAWESCRTGISVPTFPTMLFQRFSLNSPVAYSGILYNHLSEMEKSWGWFIEGSAWYVGVSWKRIAAALWFNSRIGLKHHDERKPSSGQSFRRCMRSSILLRERKDIHRLSPTEEMLSWFVRGL